jgi:hypothetical protein
MAWIDPRYAAHQRQRWTRHDAHLWVRHDAHRFKRPALDAPPTPPVSLPLAVEEKRADPAIEAVRRVLALCRLERARSLALKAGFDPGQPRDEQGRWIDTGGGEGGANAPLTDSSAARRVPPIVKQFGKWTARQFISRYCQARINSRFPREFEDATIADIWNIARGGSDRARTCQKLLNSPKYRK